MRHRAAAKSTYHSTREGKHRVTMTLLNQNSERTTFSLALPISGSWCSNLSNYLTSKIGCFQLKNAIPTPDASTVEIQNQIVVSGCGAARRPERAGHGSTGERRSRWRCTEAAAQRRET